MAVGVGFFLECGLLFIACLVLVLSRQYGLRQSSDQKTVCPVKALFSASVVVGRLVTASTRGGEGLKACPCVTLSAIVFGLFCSY